MCSLGFNREVSISSKVVSLRPNRGRWVQLGFGLVAALVGPVGPRDQGWLAFARAAAPPSLHVDLDGDGRDDTVTLDESGQLAVQRAGQAGPAQLLRMELGERYPRVTDGKLVQQQTQHGHRFVVATGQRAPGQRVALWAMLRDGKLLAAYNGPVGPVGSDGEYSLGIEVVDGVLLRYQTAPSIDRCDGERRLFVEQYAADGRWLPDPERVLPKVNAVTPLPSAIQGPSQLHTTPNGASLTPFPIFRLAAVSRQVGINRADLLTPPRELEDGQAQTAWRGAHDARGTFFTWKAELAGRSLTALRITPAMASAGGLPTQMVLTTSTKESWRVSLMGGSRPLWVVLPKPVPTSCVSLTIENAGTRDGQWSALGDVSLFTDLDGGDALAVLLGQLVSTDMRNAEAAERTLAAQIDSGDSRQAEELVKSLATAMPSSRGSTKRRHQALLGKLCARAARLSTQAQTMLLDTLMGAISVAEVEERPALFSAATVLSKQPGQASAVATSVEGLVLDARRSWPLRGQALTWIGIEGTLPQLVGLGQRVSAQPGLRAPLVETLARKLRCLGPIDSRWSTVMDAIAASQQQATWQLVLIDVLTESVLGCPGDEARRMVLEQVAAVWRTSLAIADEESRFGVRYRLLKALGRLDVATAPALLDEALRDSEPPELRQLAARVLAKTRPLDVERIKRALADPDAGVRAMLLAGLAGQRDDSVTPLVIPLVTADLWPMVRRAAAEVIASVCQSGTAPPDVVVTTLERALADADDGVAGLSLQGLSRCLGARGLSRYQALLTDGKAAPTVRGQACLLVARHGLGSPATAAKAHQAIGEGLGDLIDDPQAADRSLVAAVQCMRALGEHGDGRDLGLLLARLDREAPAGLRRGAAEAVLKICQRQTTALAKDDRQGLADLLRLAAEPGDSLLHNLLPKLKATCGPWSTTAR